MGKKPCKSHNLLNAKHLVKSFNGRRVVNDVSIEINKGEIVGLLGPNGAGKSTTFYMIVGRILPEFGSVLLGDIDLTALPMYQRARVGLGYLPQETSVFRRLTVRQNLDLVLEESGMEQDEREEKIRGLLNNYGLVQIQNVLGISLSGGERRRVEIARCLALDPSFILLDEVILNDGDLHHLELQVLKCHKHYLQTGSAGFPGTQR